MNIKKYRKIIFLFLTGLIYYSGFAKEYNVKYEKTGTAEQAAGNYFITDEGYITYTYLNGKVANLLEISEFRTNTPDLRILSNRLCTGTKELYDNDFYAFDSQGNFYFATNTSYTTLNYLTIEDGYKEAENALFIYKFNPVKQVVRSYEFPSNSSLHSFCVSNDGNWVFVDMVQSIEPETKKGKAYVYAFPAGFNTEPNVLYSSSIPEEAFPRSVRNVCFDNNTNTVYYSVHKPASDSLFGLYSVHPDIDGNYSVANLKFYTQFADIPMKLYSNENGVWGITPHRKNPDASELIQVTDSDGNILPISRKSYSKVQIKGNWQLKPDVKVNKNAVILAGGNNPVLIILLITALLVIIGLVIYILYLVNKSNKIRKNKQFIYNIQEAERGKISRDIHDSIIQDIRAIRIESELIKSDAETEKHRQKVIDIATECVVKLRNICYNLTPAELTTHEDGDSSKIELVSIIQSLVLQFIERTHVPCQLKIDENFEYPVFEKETSQNLFRIIQEALTNIEKHSYATNCQILIKNKTEDGKLYTLIYISDDGVGCDPKQLLKKRMHFGIHNMIERAKLIGASIEFQSEPGNGLEIRIQI